jgi:hypothetical protein
MVLVSYPESGILGGICGLGELWEGYTEATEKRAAIRWPARCRCSYSLSKASAHLDER